MKRRRKGWYKKAKQKWINNNVYYFELKTYNPIFETNYTYNVVTGRVNRKWFGDNQPEYFHEMGRRGLVDRFNWAWKTSLSDDSMSFYYQKRQYKK